MSADKKTSDHRIAPGSFWDGAWKYPAVLAAVGTAGAAWGFVNDAERFGYAYLFAFFVVLTLSLGGIFLVVVQHLTAGHWGVSSRRIAELIACGMPAVALLFLPILGGVLSGKLTMYDEWIGSHGAEGEEAPEHDEAHAHTGLFEAVPAHAQEHAAAPEGEAAAEHTHTPQEVELHHATLAKKAGYLNPRGWAFRAVGYFAIWLLLSLGYFRLSRKQDETKDKQLTVKMASLAPVSTILFALSLTFAAFDWLMSLEPTWYSTIFGVIIFAGSAVAILALVIVIALSLHEQGVIGDAVNVEHFHDLGKLMFGFICFWTYVSFSQWMLIWYAGIPEEATWYHRRWEGGWHWVSYGLIFGHFALPFYFLISRVVKRNLPMLRMGAMWMLMLHVVDIYWFVLPQAHTPTLLRPEAVDVACLLFTGGVFFTVLFLAMRRVPLVPIGDPRLARSLHHHQTH